MSQAPFAERLPRFALPAILAVCVLTRLPLLAEAPLAFSALRQHHSALIARDLHLAARPGEGPEWQRVAAADYVAAATIPEPRSVERIAAFAYAAAGREDLWIARALSLAYWCAGAVFLFAAARRWWGPAAGLAAAAMFVCLPYSLEASISFQPDTLAVMCMCGSLAALARFDRARGEGGLAALTVFTLAAVFVRPPAGLILYPAIVAVLWRHRSAIFVVAASALPAAIYAAVRWLNDPGYATRIGVSFVPSMLTDVSFWRGWAGLAWRAFGVVMPFAIVGALVGAVRTHSRTALVALWIGYALYGLFFTFQIATHPYYQTLAVPVIALSLAALIARTPKPIAAIALASALMLGWSAWQGHFTPASQAGMIGDYESIGRLVDHSRKVIFLSPDWGVPLRYHAGIAGRSWPARFEVEMYRPLGSGGIRDLPAVDRLAETSASLGGAEFFVVTDPAEFQNQPDLQALLATRARERDRTPRYVVYELAR